MTKVFISYSRRDRVFVRRLFDALDLQSHDAWVDWKGIPYSTEWWLEICRGIEHAENFIYVISPDSLGSKICNEELNYAHQLNKRIIPVIRREINEKFMAGEWYGKTWENQARQNWEMLKKINWLYFRRKDDCDCQFDDHNEIVNPECDGPECDRDSFVKAFQDLTKTVTTDDEYVRRHTRLLVRANEWEGNSRNPSFLLRGEDLAVARQWLEQSVGKSPGPLPLHREYVQSSRAYQDEQIALDEKRTRELNTATQRAEQSAKQATIQQGRARQRTRIALGVIGLAVIVGIVASVLIISAQQQTAQANQNADNAQNTVVAANATLTPIAQNVSAISTQIQVGNNVIESQRLAAFTNEILQQPGGNVEMAALLAIRGLKAAYTEQADAALVRATDRLFTRQAFVGHTGAVNSVAIAPDSQTILTGGEGTTALLWNIHTGQSLRTFRGHTGKITGVTFAPDGQSILTGSADNTAKLWDVRTGQVLQTFTGHRSSVTSVAFAPDGQTVVAGGRDGIALAWDSQSGDLLRAFINPDDPYQSVEALTGQIALNSLAISPDSRLIVTGGYEKISRVRDIHTGNLVSTLNTGIVYGIAFSPDGQTILTGGLDNIAQIWDVHTGQLLHTFAGHTDSVFSVAFAPDGRSMLTGSKDGTARWWNISAPPDRVFTGYTDAVSTVAFSPDAQTILAGSFDGTARLWDVHTDQLLRIFSKSSDHVNSVAFSLDGQSVLTGGNGEVAWLWNVKTGELIQTFTGHTKSLSGVAFSPVGKTIMTVADDLTARLWDKDTAQQLQTFRIPGENLIFSVAFSPDGQTILTGSDDMTARLLDTHTGQLLHTFAGHKETVTSVAFAPDGQTILTGSDDNTARIWDVHTGRVLQTFTGHTHVVTSVAFSPTGQNILTGSDDKTVRLWDVRTGQTIRLFTGHTGAVNSMAFSPDGKSILTGSDDKTVRLWDADFRDFISYACTPVFHDFTVDERKLYSITDLEPTCPQFATSGTLTSVIPQTTIPIPGLTLPLWTPIASPTASDTPAPTYPNVLLTFTPSPSSGPSP